MEKYDAEAAARVWQRVQGKPAQKEELDSLPLREALQRLPKELKDVVILRYFSGCTLAETAETLQIPQGTVVTRQRRALKLLRLELEEVEL